jgi:glutamate/tyrosine decarboxylase-like PLP-dependent enzyme
MQGTRGGGPISASYATLLTLGEEGYLRQSKEIFETSKYLQSNN